MIFVKRNGEMKKKIKGKKKMNSVNEGRKVDEDEAKRKKGRNKEVRDQNFNPTLKLSQEQSQLS